MGVKDKDNPPCPPLNNAIKKSQSQEGGGVKITALSALD